MTCGPFMVNSPISPGVTSRVPDRKYGELVCAWIVPAVGGPPNIEELKSFCREQLSGYKVPREFRVCDALPENFLGKVRRIELRKRAA